VCCFCVRKQDAPRPVRDTLASKQFLHVSYLFGELDSMDEFHRIDFRGYVLR
jgi:hypothetical protein